MREPTPAEIMTEALKGAGFTRAGMPMAKKLWVDLFQAVRPVELAYAELGIDTLKAESEVDATVKRVLGALLARHRYAAALKGNLNKGRGRRKTAPVGST